MNQVSEHNDRISNNSRACNCYPLASRINIGEVNPSIKQESR